jgi:hypothetical protein
MPALVAATVLLGLLCTLNLVLIVGVVKRLRGHSALLAEHRREREPGPVPEGLAVGEAVGDFTASTVDGALLTPDDVRDETLVAFFSPGCAPCVAEVPRFVDHVRTTLSGRRERAWAVVVDDGTEDTSFVSQLSAVARVFVEQQGGSLESAVQASVYPMVLSMAPGADGRPVITSNDVRLGRPAAVRAA